MHILYASHCTQHGRGTGTGGRVTGPPMTTCRKKIRASSSVPQWVLISPFNTEEGLVTSTPPVSLDWVWVGDQGA